MKFQAGRLRVADNDETVVEFDISYEITNPVTASVIVVKTPEMIYRVSILAVLMVIYNELFN